MDLPIGMCTASAPTDGNEFQIFPAGRFNAQDGRPKDAPAWFVDGTIAARLIAEFNANKNPMVVDYEHQTVLAKDNGKPAPAAGWVHRLEWREGEGLFAVDVKWTDAARACIQNDEYRYISPVFHYDRQTGEVRSLLNAALTNLPALDGMGAAVALRHQLEAQSAELECLRRDMAGREIDKVIDEACSDGRLLPYQVEAAREIGGSNLAALKTLLDRPSLVPPLQSKKLAIEETATCGLNYAELRMCNLTGRSPEEFAALKKKFGSETL